MPHLAFSLNMNTHYFQSFCRKGYNRKKAGEYGYQFHYFIFDDCNYFIFVASEFALVKIRRSRLEQLERKM